MFRARHARYSCGDAPPGGPGVVATVVRTATSEIEHYSRVSLSLAADPPVFAHLALPIAHLLAELLENATNFSDPGSTVVVMATATESGVRMTVADDGLGLPPEELAEINARIEQPLRLGDAVVGVPGDGVLVRLAIAPQRRDRRHSGGAAAPAVPPPAARSCGTGRRD